MALIELSCPCTHYYKILIETKAPLDGNLGDPAVEDRARTLAKDMFGQKAAGMFRLLELAKCAEGCNPFVYSDAHGSWVQDSDCSIKNGEAVCTRSVAYVVRCQPKKQGDLPIVEQPTSEMVVAWLKAITNPGEVPTENDQPIRESLVVRCGDTVTFDMRVSAYADEEPHPDRSLDLKLKLLTELFEKVFACAKSEDPGCACPASPIITNNIGHKADGTSTTERLQLFIQYTPFPTTFTVNCPCRKPGESAPH